MSNRTFMFKAGHTLIWELTGDIPGEALRVAKEFGAIAEAQDLGSWDFGPIGLGSSCWFDLILRDDLTALRVMRMFDRLPDNEY